MSIVKISILCWSIFGLAFVIMCFYMFYQVKTKTISLDQNEPFNTWVGRTVTLNRETVLFRSNMNKFNNNYPHELCDSLHPLWDYKNHESSTNPQRCEISAVFPAGTTLRIDKSEQYISGENIYTFVSGTIESNGNTYNVVYHWGRIDRIKEFAKIKKHWFFHQAPWQNTVDTAFYEI